MARWIVRASMVISDDSYRRVEWSGGDSYASALVVAQALIDRHVELRAQGTPFLASPVVEICTPLFVPDPAPKDDAESAQLPPARDEWRVGR